MTATYNPVTRELAHTVTARKALKCESYSAGWCLRPVVPGEDYARVVAFPGHDVWSGPGVWVLRICSACWTRYGREMPPRRSTGARSGGG